MFGLQDRLLAGWWASRGAGRDPQVPDESG
jgi:hypothetical protein